MKYLFFTFLFSSFLLACSSPEKPRDNKDNSIKIVEKKDTIDPNTILDTSVLRLYVASINKLSSSNFRNVALAKNYFDTWFTGKNSLTCDSAYQVFDIFLKNCAVKNSEVDFSGTSLNEDSEFYNEKGEFLPEVQKLNQKYQSYGLEITSTEGMLLIQENRGFVNKIFHHRVSEPLKKILELERKESNQWASHDAGLSISGKEMVDRLEAWSNLQDSTFNSVLSKKNVLDNCRYYRSLLLTNSLDNSPIYWTDAEEIDPVFKEAYTYWKKRYPKSKTLRIARKYVDLLLEGKFVSAEAELKTFPKKYFIEW